MRRKLEGTSNVLTKTRPVNSVTQTCVGMAGLQVEHSCWGQREAPQGASASLSWNHYASTTLVLVSFVRKRQERVTGTFGTCQVAAHTPHRRLLCLCLNPRALAGSHSLQYLKSHILLFKLLF